MIKARVKIEPFSENQARPGVISYGLSSYGYDLRLGYKFKVFTDVFGSTCIDPKAFNPENFIERDLTPVARTGERHFWSRDSKDANQFVCDFCGVIARGKPSSPVACVREIDQGPLIIPANSFALAESIESVWVPRECLTVCVGKSTYARCGIIVNVTPLEPEWFGKVTIEVSNTTPLPAKVYPGEGILQMLFLETAGYTDLNSRDVQHLYKRINGIEEKVGECEEGEENDPEFVAAVRKDAGCHKSYADKKGIYQGQEGLSLPRVRGTEEGS